MKRRIFFAITLLVMLASSLFFWRASFLQEEKSASTNSEQVSQKESIVEKKQDEQIKLIENKAEVDESKTDQVAVIIEKGSVPFTSQAPTGDWSDTRFQDGCEEASVAMAMRWIQGKTFSSPEDAKQEIFDIAKLEDKTFGHHIDASLEDVGKILSQHYDFENFVIKKDFTLVDLKDELERGNIILAPAFGRALKNPNFTSPGPIAHMLVIVGFDQKTKEFITNDPGTKNGEGYRYDENVLFDAIWAYPSSNKHAPVPKSTAKKAVLVVSGS